MRRKERDASRGSPGSFAAQKTLAQDDSALRGFKGRKETR